MHPLHDIEIPQAIDIPLDPAASSLFLDKRTGLDVAAIGENKLEKLEISRALPPRIQETLREAQRIRTDPAAYLAALRDWAHRGAESRFALRQFFRRLRQEGREASADDPFDDSG